MFNVLDEAEGGVVPGLDGVDRGEDGGACVEGCDDTRLGDGDGLLFHGFMEDGTCCSVYFILNDANNED